MLFDVRMINSSGIGTYVKSLILPVCKEFETTLITDDKTALLNYYPNANIIELASPIYSVSEQLRYAFLPSAVILFTPHYNVPILPVRAKKRVATIHDVYHLAFYDQLSIAQKIYAKFMINIAVKLSDVIITVSEFSKKEIVRYTGCPANKISVIYNGVKQLPIYTPAQIVRKKYALPENYILYVGNVKPHKNLLTMLQAYLLLEPKVRAVYKIVIAGKKNGFITGDDQIIEFIEKSQLTSNIVFTGFIEDEDMDRLYAEASLFVFPSLYEGFGLPPLEAMLNNCPVIASHAASIPEICGDAALYFNPLDAKEMALSITSVLNDAQLRLNLIQNGKRRVSNFTLKRSIDSHLQLFKNLIQVNQ